MKGNAATGKGSRVVSFVGRSQVVWSFIGGATVKTYDHLVVWGVVVDSGPRHVEVASCVWSHDHNMGDIGVPVMYSQG